MTRFFKLPFSISVHHILLVLVSFLVAFIPLFPKVPLVDVLPGYIVRMRVEDLLIGIAFLLWTIQVIRKKISWNTPLTIIFGLNMIVGALSLLSAVFIIETIPAETLHVGKSVLHYLRNFEYFSLFLITYSSIRSKRDAQTIIWTMILTFVAVSVYAFGQKYYLWPVYSTMNREFSKGIALQLTEHARVQSTFGGHYDLGGYIVMIAPIMLVLSFLTQKKWLKRILFGLFLVSCWLIVVSASRISFGGYVVAINIALLLLLFIRSGTWFQKILWGVKQCVMYTGIILLFFAAFGSDLADRYTHLIDSNPQLREKYHELNGQRKHIIAGIKDGSIFTGVERTVTPTPTAVPTPDPVTDTDTQPKPRDVVVDVPEKTFVPVVDESGATTGFDYVEKQRQYSENALKYGLSLGIRLDATWPQALRGFERNPLLGSGYATLNKESVYHFTEADSSDNNFLRTLGETGLLGFTTYYGTILLAITWCIRWLYERVGQDVFTDWLAISFIAATVGLSINALMIDIFVSSKVAFIFWAFAGVVLATIVISQKQHKQVTL